MPKQKKDVEQKSDLSEESVATTKKSNSKLKKKRAAEDNPPIDIDANVDLFEKELSKFSTINTSKVSSTKKQKLQTSANAGITSTQNNTAEVISRSIIEDKTVRVITLLNNKTQKCSDTIFEDNGSHAFGFAVLCAHPELLMDYIISSDLTSEHHPPSAVTNAAFWKVQADVKAFLSSKRNLTTPLYESLAQLGNALEVSSMKHIDNIKIHLRKFGRAFPDPRCLSYHILLYSSGVGIALNYKGEDFIMGSTENILKGVKITVSSMNNRATIRIQRPSYLLINDDSFPDLFDDVQQASLLAQSYDVNGKEIILTNPIDQGFWARMYKHEVSTVLKARSLFARIRDMQKKL